MFHHKEKEFLQRLERAFKPRKVNNNINFLIKDGHVDNIKATISDNKLQILSKRFDVKNPNQKYCFDSSEHKYVDLDHQQSSKHPRLGIYYEIIIYNKTKEVGILRINSKGTTHSLIELLIKELEIEENDISLYSNKTVFLYDRDFGKENRGPGNALNRKSINKVLAVAPLAFIDPYKTFLLLKNEQILYELKITGLITRNANKASEKDSISNKRREQDTISNKRRERDSISNITTEYDFIFNKASEYDFIFSNTKKIDYLFRRIFKYHLCTVCKDYVASVLLLDEPLLMKNKFLCDECFEDFYFYDGVMIYPGIKYERI